MKFRMIMINRYSTIFNILALACISLIQVSAIAQSSASSLSNAFPFGAVTNNPQQQQGAAKYSQFMSICRQEKHAEIYMSSDVSKKRLQLLESKLKENATNSTVVMAYLKEFLIQKNYKEFDAKYAKHKEALSDEDLVLVNADVELFKKNYPAAVSTLEKYLKDHSKSTRALLKLAEVHKARESYSEARDIYNDLAKENPKLDLSKELCENYMLDSLHRDAETQCFKALQKHPQDYLIPIYLGISYREQELFDKATEQFKASLKIQPSEFAYSCLGELKQIDKKNADALDFFKQALDADSKSYRAHLGIAQSYFAEKKYAESLESYKAACRLNPKDLDGFKKAFKDLNDGKSKFANQFLTEIQNCKRN